ncbi:neurofilament light polypeptide-like [Coffea eugenioides]|uniref:neurofilament light polypeptide-like n=1 Tax=Coffea eugenioides TaxID=49369 RepID=UPI000F60AF7C|nr:neurofilament light polypeptide-like [Coffea eugenioides]
MHSPLPRDLEFMKKLSPAEMVQSLMVSTASTSAFVAEMTHRYCALVEEQDTGKLQNQISKLEKKLAVSESEKAELQRQLKEAEAKGEEAEVTINSLRSALEEEQKRGDQVKKSHEQALNSVGASAVEAFRRSEAFTKDLGQLLTPNFMFGFTSGVDAAAAHLSSEALESLKNNDSYNEDSKELCDRMAEGLQAGRNLAEVQNEFNKWLSELDEVFEEGEEAGEDEAGGDIGEEHGEELHPGRGESGEKAAHDGAETGNGAETGV